MSVRTQRVGALIQEAVQAVLVRGLADPRVRGLITVTGVVVSDDLRQATVRVSVLPAEHAELTLHGLRAASAHIRHKIADAIALPETPRLLFKIDRGAREQAGVLAALARVRAEQEEAGATAHAPDAGDAPTDGEPDERDHQHGGEHQ